MVLQLDIKATMYSLLMIDDDKTFCDLTARYLTVEGFKINVCHNPIEGLDRLSNKSFDLLLLDVMMPEMSGLDLLKEIRSKSKLPIIICTALEDDTNEIVGLETGADDYLKKSAHPRVMLAKINSVLRRAHDNFEVEDGLKIHHFDDIVINLKERTVKILDESIDLTVSEFNILSYLIKTPHEPKSKKAISEDVLGKKITMHDRSIDTHISRLRTKLGNRPNKTARIKTIQGYGYQWNMDD